MSWAKYIKEKLKNGEMVSFRPRGNSMAGRIEDNQLVTVKPCEMNELAAGDVVLVKVNGRDYLHLIKAIDRGRYLIGNNKGKINGWVGFNCIFGKVVE